jgi:anti-sigma B factor antagonist
MNGCNTRDEGEFRIVAVSGEVDLSWSSELRTSILDAMSSAQTVMVDLSEVSYIDSSGIAALVEGYQKAKGKSIRFGLLGISDAVRAVLELARLDQVFPIHANLDSVD